jgi:hypothetical protein
VVDFMIKFRNFNLTVERVVSSLGQEGFLKGKGTKFEHSKYIYFFNISRCDGERLSPLFGLLHHPQISHHGVLFRLGIVN